MKIIFLDCDGVLNRQPTKEELEICRSEHWTKKLENKIVGLNPDLVKHLKSVVDATGASIVASTSWRYYDDHPTVGPDWRQTLADMIGKDKSIFLGNTPDLSTANGWSSGTYSRHRGNEIKFWLENNTEPGKFKYVVVDDEVNDIVNVIPCKNVVQTDEKVGLTKELANKMIRILND